MGNQTKGDFTGFSFDGIHSSELGIVRVSDGSRYNDNLLPTIQDKTVQVPGGDGMYYFGSYYTQKSFNISIAYDSLTEENLKKIKEIFGSKTPKKLIFDESPYKFYWTKSTGTSNLKFICFNDSSQIRDKDVYKGEGRIYKGEGTLNLIAYDPYGYSVSRNIKDFEDYNNRDDWLAASGILEDDTVEGNSTNIKGKSSISISNNGEVETDWELIFSGTSAGGSITYSNGVFSKTIQISSFEKSSGDVKVKLSSKTNLLSGITSKGDLTGNIYNEYVEGEFFKLPLGPGTLEIKGLDAESFDFHYKYY